MGNLPIHDCEMPLAYHEGHSHSTDIDIIKYFLNFIQLMTGDNIQHNLSCGTFVESCRDCSRLCV